MNGTRSPLINIGVVGIVLCVTICLTALQFDRLPFVRAGAEFNAYFADAGGLLPGDPVQVAGVRTGRVEEVELDGAKVKVRFTLDENIVLGGSTSAAIKTNTLLGRKSLEVTPAGSGAIRKDDVIPLDRTTSPYSLTDALSELTTTVQGLDTDQVNRTLDTLSEAFTDTPGPLRSALDGITALSKSLNTRDDALLQLLGRAQNVTSVLGERAAQINSLLVDGNSLLGELDARRAAISQLIVYVNGLAQQLSGFVADNEEQLKPTLDKLNSVLELLQNNRDNISKALIDLGPFAGALGEQVGSGPYFQAYLANGSGKMLQVLVDAMVWPEHLPDALREWLNPLPSIQPAIVEPPR
ncbi:MCE family protein [Nocardia sp. 2]|uniref:MCE family protein n=1 Tax=Nocardia acididurans TaxID=2802282 RepID=A0ABS1MB58_9NOCA|nr:MCE family protein [Nocardia acididurans]MBL1077511.1 MCE family protein [Nocardia acididurans]